ncbi:MAG TPA: response regulator transcription factor [Terriglobales bacterium]
MDSVKGCVADHPEQQGKLLLIDDDVELCALMHEYFTAKGYLLDSVNNGRDGLARALEEKHDLIILDGMLPVLDGFEVLRQLRKRSAIPVIMLTARTQERDRITGLETGADDYLPKPFGPDELLARIRAVLRRYGSQRPRPEVLRVGPIELNSDTRVVRRGDETVSVTDIEFQILELLMRAAGRIVTRDEIAAVLYQREATPYERSLDVHISHLRKKIETDDVPLIRTVRGSGYTMTLGAVQ